MSQSVVYTLHFWRTHARTQGSGQTTLQQLIYRPRRTDAAMSRSKVYTLHFWPKLEHAGHYTGASDKLPARLVDHVLGRGARITQVQRERGGSWVVGRVEPGGRDRERQLKNQHNAAKHCDVCHSLRDVEKGRITKEEALAKSGWSRASEYERGMLLEIFGMEKPPPGPSWPSPRLSYPYHSRACHRDRSRDRRPGRRPVRRMEFPKSRSVRGCSRIGG